MVNRLQSSSWLAPEKHFLEEILEVPKLEEEETYIFREESLLIQIILFSPEVISKKNQKNDCANFL